MTIKSCGILLYRNLTRDDLSFSNVEIFLIQANTNVRMPELWGVPKGRMEVNEKPLQTAKREFREETGCEAPDLNYQPLPLFKTKRGKTITVFYADSGRAHIAWNRNRVALTSFVRNNREGLFRETRGGKWMSLEEAYTRIGSGQSGILDDFVKVLHLERCKSAV